MKRALWARSWQSGAARRSASGRGARTEWPSIPRRATSPARGLAGSALRPRCSLPRANPRCTPGGSALQLGQLVCRSLAHLHFGQQQLGQVEPQRRLTPEAEVDQRQVPRSRFAPTGFADRHRRDSSPWAGSRVRRRTTTSRRRRPPAEISSQHRRRSTRGCRQTSSLASGGRTACVSRPSAKPRMVRRTSPPEICASGRTESTRRQPPQQIRRLLESLDLPAGFDDRDGFQPDGRRLRVELDHGVRRRHGHTCRQPGRQIGPIDPGLGLPRQQVQQ